MSGLKHDLGDTHYYRAYPDREPLVAVEYPAIGEAEREIVIEAIKHGGYERGLRDGRARLGRLDRGHPEAAPIPAKHIALHAKAALKALAADISSVGLTAAQCLKHWLAGYSDGVRTAFDLKGQAFQSPGDPDAERGE